MTSISRNVGIDKLDDIINEYKNTHHKKVKMKPIDVNSNTYTGLNVGKIDKDPIFEVSDHVRTSKHRKTFVKGYTPNSIEKTFVIKNVKNNVPWTECNKTS